MNRIEFKAGYYEWNIFIDGDYFYTFGADISEEFHEDITCAELENIVEDCIDCMNIDLQTNEKDMLDESLRAELKEQMVAVWSYHYGIAD